MSAQRTSSPASTGGAGTFFEQHVASYWLAQLLVRSVPPILLDSSIVEVSFQTEHLGWNNDDFLVVAETGAGTTRRLAGQVKKTFTVSASDEDCKAAIEDFWKDFKDAKQFSADSDRFVLVTQRGTNTLLDSFAGLLDCARGARDGTAFEGRLSTPGFIGNKSIQYCAEICTIVSEVEGRPVTRADLWPFLRVLHVLSLDLATATSQTAAMVRTLLAHTANEPDPIGAAEASWTALLGVASEGMSQARSFRYEDLPNALRQRHAVLGPRDHRALWALSEHSELVLRGIRSSLGGNLHLPRASLVQRVIDQTKVAQIVLVSGAAGAGKSAVAKDAVAVLSRDYFVFGFRAEEFAQPHLDATLQNAQIPANAVTLAAVLAGHDQKVLLVESVERLLEKSTREAFNDLLSLAGKDQSLRIILTCRDYSTDLVRTCFLGAIDHSVIVVPALTDDDLSQVEAAFPTIARPLGNASLRQVLRNPYILDKALQIPWAEERSLPTSEREFRVLFWQQFVRAEQRLASGMPRRREEAFKDIAVRRARALAMYVSCAEVDSEVIESLRHDSLIQSPESTPLLVAPAHDVLEDWAIVQWIEEHHITGSGSFHALSVTIGTHPAIRRAFRKWVSEVVERDPAATDRLFQGAVLETDVPVQFRDDTLVALLRSPASPAFLIRQSEMLLANSQSLLRRVIHLLRIACVTTPAWFAGARDHGSALNVPDGPAWAPVLQLVRTNIEVFGSDDHLLLLGLIEDFCRGVAWWSPYPDGSESVAAIAHWLLPRLDTYRSEGARERTLKAIAKIPNADASGFESLLRGSPQAERRERTGDAFREIVFTGLDGMPAARDLPDVLISVGLEYILCSEADVDQEGHFAGSLELETLFGLNHGLRFFPPSAYRGPLLPLLQHHPGKALEFIFKVFNHSVDLYAHPRLNEGVEPPFEIELRFADRTTRKQWANHRLWCWYRGSSVGPTVLQSFLMALERWLQECGETYPQQLDGVLLRILRQSDSAALTAVVASAATAHSRLAGETLLVLLSSPLCIRLDRQRLSLESQSPSTVLSGLLPGAENRIYEDEHKDADKMPHRGQDLECAIANLQLGPLRPRVQAMLDEHRQQLPPVEEQDDDDRAWRLSMHRMDLRQYTVGEEVKSEEDAGEGGEQPQHYVQLEPVEPEPDVKEMMDKTTEQFHRFNARIRLVMWAMHVFKRERNATHDPAKWRECLVQAQTSGATGIDDDEDFDPAAGGPGMVAAVCLRDHWEEMSADEQNWCADVVCHEVMRHADNWNHLARVQRYDRSPDRACAGVLPLLFGRSLSEERRTALAQAFVAALTHPVNEVRGYAAEGISIGLWPIDRQLAIRSVNAIATDADLVDKARALERRRLDEGKPIDELAAAAASSVRQRFWQENGIADDAYDKLDIDAWFGAEANRRILTILVGIATDPIAVSAFVRAARALAKWWDDGDHRRREGAGRRRERNYEGESAVSQILQDFVMRTSDTGANAVLEPILKAIDDHTREIHWFVRGLTSIEDVRPNTAHFWSIWRLFADGIRQAKWIAWMDNEHPVGDEMISAIFLGSYWKEHVRHWKSLEGYADSVHALFEDLPPSAVVLDDYVRFLYHIGEQSLPASFLRIADRIRAGDAKAMLEKTNTIFILEVLLQRHVYVRPLELKSVAAIKEAVLYLLDTLVENGSSAAFRMRDDFVTPITVG